MIGVGGYLAFLATKYTGVILQIFLSGGLGVVLAGLLTCVMAVMGLVAALVQSRALLIAVSCACM